MEGAKNMHASGAKPPEATGGGKNSRQISEKETKRPSRPIALETLMRHLPPERRFLLSQTRTLVQFACHDASGIWLLAGKRLNRLGFRN
jgi:hypothetical protein